MPKLKKVTSKAKSVQGRTLAIGDLHEPFTHPDAIPFLKAAYDWLQPSHVVLLGDEIDAHALSEYAHDPDGMSPEDEHKAALKGLKDLYALFEGQEEILVCESNHTVRPFKKASKAGIPSRFLRDYADILQAPDTWKWAPSWEVDGVIYEHGESYGGREGAMRSAEKNMCSTVIGHIHSHAGIQFSQTPKKLIFGFNVGCLIDDTAYAFAYAKHMKSRPTLGVGAILGGVSPIFIPMLLDKNKRWTGRLFGA